MISYGMVECYWDENMKRKKKQQEKKVRDGKKRNRFILYDAMSCLPVTMPYYGLQYRDFIRYDASQDKILQKQDRHV